MLTHYILVASAAAFGVVACSSPEMRPAAGPNTGQRAVPSQEVAAPRAYANTQPVSQIYVAESIRRACGLQVVEAYFAFDSAELGGPGKTSIGKIATCFTSGPLAGRNLSLVGHADPRGDDEYNMLLGGRRAQSVSDALFSMGVPRIQLSATSRGEMDALGTEETGWVLDRRVNLDLAK